MSVFVNEVRPNESAGAPPVFSRTHDELTSMTVKELTAMCAENGIDIPNKAKKADIVSAIESAMG